MNKCEKCGFLHYRTDPCRKPKNTQATVDMVRPISAALAPEAVRDSQKLRKSTAARKADVLRVGSDDGGKSSTAPRREHVSRRIEPLSAETSNRVEPREISGTVTSRISALPVDANMGEAQKVERRSPKPEDAGSIPATYAKFDKVAYQRAYMAKYRRGEVGNKYRQPLPKHYD